MADDSKADLENTASAEAGARNELPVSTPSDAVAEPGAKVTPLVREGLSDQHNRLRDAMRRARLNEAERRDVIVSLREGALARLELLQDELGDVFDSVPADSDLFDGAILPGNPPRLWVDVLGFVAMGHDQRTYQFVQETRYGRRTILETTRVDDMAARVTDYVANRVLERERALASDEADAIARKADAPARETAAAQANETLTSETPAPEKPADEAMITVANRQGVSESGSSRRLAMVGWFLLGMIAGAVALFAYGAQYVVD